VDVRRTLSQIAAAQHGLVTVDQAVGAGLTAGQIRWLTRSAEWVPLRPRVYGLVGSPPTRMQMIMATSLGLQPEAWLSHGAAGELWGLVGVSSAEIEVVTRLERRVGLEGVRGHRSASLFTADFTSGLHMPVTTPERTLVDLSGRLTRAALARALDDGRRRRIARLDRLHRCVDRLAGSPGRRPAVIHALLAERLPGYDPGDSDLETRVLRLIVKNRLPVPAQQHRVRLGGRTIRIDLAYPDRRLAIELDGWEFHRTGTAFDTDRERANLLVAAGWSLVRFTSRSTDPHIVDCLRAACHRFGSSGAA
jgi:very-short-patch-repair endonuclease